MARILLLTVLLLAFLTPAGAVVRRADTVSYTPPAQPGDIFTVIDFARRGGTAEPATVSEVMGERSRDLTVVPYPSCADASPAGAVVRFRHFDAARTPLTVSTSGQIVRGPYQGSLPPEALHRCYQLVS
jgi:hypothetical protein